LHGQPLGQTLENETQFIVPLLYRRSYKGDESGVEHGLDGHLIVFYQDEYFIHSADLIDFLLVLVVGDVELQFRPLFFDTFELELDEVLSCGLL